MKPVVPPLQPLQGALRSPPSDERPRNGGFDVVVGAITGDGDGPGSASGPSAVPVAVLVVPGLDIDEEISGEGQVGRLATISRAGQGASAAGGWRSWVGVEEEYVLLVFVAAAPSDVEVGVVPSVVEFNTVGGVADLVSLPIGTVGAGGSSVTDVAVDAYVAEGGAAAGSEAEYW